MSEQETSKLNYLIQKFEDHASFVKEELATIKRGVYGDPANKVPGLIGRQEEDERRIGSIEEKLKIDSVKKRTIIWVLGIVYAALQAIGIAIYEFFKSRL